MTEQEKQNYIKMLQEDIKYFLDNCIFPGLLFLSFVYYYRKVWDDVFAPFIEYFTNKNLKIKKKGKNNE